MLNLPIIVHKSLKSQIHLLRTHSTHLVYRLLVVEVAILPYVPPKALAWGHYSVWGQDSGGNSRKHILPGDHWLRGTDNQNDVQEMESK